MCVRGVYRRRRERSGDWGRLDAVGGDERGGVGVGGRDAGGGDRLVAVDTGGDFEVQVEKPAEQVGLGVRDRGVLLDMEV